MNWIPAFAGMTDDWIPPAFPGIRWGFLPDWPSAVINIFQYKAGHIKHHISSAQS